MREIKFRAWDKEANIMVYSDHRTRKLYDVYYGFEMNGEGELECRWEGEFTESHVLDGGMLDNLMQYTGLKDKNGKEIYEGDILKIQTSDFYSKKIIDKYIAQVCFSRGGFFVLTDGHHTDFSLWGKSTETMEVIGSIYENADLLEEEEDAKSI